MFLLTNPFSLRDIGKMLLILMESYFQKMRYAKEQLQMGIQRKKQQSIAEEVDKEKRYSLFLHNDDLHSFDYVIDALVDICNHSTQQATQCTYLVHFKGKCDIKQGSMDYLKPMREALAGRSLKATIK